MKYVIDRATSDAAVRYLTLFNSGSWKRFSTATEARAFIESSARKLIKSTEATFWQSGGICLFASEEERGVTTIYCMVDPCRWDEDTQKDLHDDDESEFEYV